MRKCSYQESRQTHTDQLAFRSELTTILQFFENHESPYFRTISAKPSSEFDLYSQTSISEFSKLRSLNSLNFNFFNLTSNPDTLRTPSHAPRAKELAPDCIATPSSTRVYISYKRHISNTSTFIDLPARSIYQPISNSNFTFPPPIFRPTAFPHGPTIQYPLKSIWFRRP